MPSFSSAATATDWGSGSCLLPSRLGMRKAAIHSSDLQSFLLDEIDSQDDSYRITTRTDTDELQISIQHESLLNPPVIIKKNSAATIVSGFRRIEACRKIGLDEIEARVLEPELSSLDCLRIAIADNALQRPLNLIETSRCLHKLSLLLSNGKRLSETAASLNLPANPAIIGKIKDLCLLPWTVQNAILADTISLAMALELGTLESETAISFARIFNQLKLGLNKQREVLTLVKEIGARDGISMRQVLENSELQTLLNSEELDRAQKGRKLRTILRQRRFPRIVAAEKEFELCRRNLKLANEIKLSPPKEFERAAYSLTLTFSNPADLSVLHARLPEIIENPWFKKIFKIK